MSDNVIVSANVGVGATVATDDVSGVQFQRVKLALGADGNHDGDVSYAYPMPISGAMGTGDITTDAWGVQKVSLPKSLFHGMFTFDVPQTKWMMYEGGVQVYTSTHITSDNGAGKITADGTAADVLVESRVCPRYQPNRGHLFSSACWMPSKTANGIREWGVGTTENGVMFRLKSDGILYAVLYSGGVETYEQAIDITGVAGFDVQKGNVYDIQYQWRGVGNYKFFINLTHVHTFDHLGTLTALSMENPALPVHLHSESLDGSEVSLYIGCVDITSENGIEEQLEYGSSYAASVAVTTNTPVLVIKQPLLIGGVTNTRDLTLARISFICSKKAVFKVWTTRDSTAFTGGTFQTVNSGSYVETDSPDMNGSAARVTAVNTAKLRFVTAVPVEAAVPREVDNPWPAGINFPIVRGDYVVVTCTAATATADCVIEWGEHI